MLLVYTKVLDWNGGRREGACILGSANIRLDELSVSLYLSLFSLSVSLLFRLLLLPFLWVVYAYVCVCLCVREGKSTEFLFTWVCNVCVVWLCLWPSVTDGSQPLSGRVMCEHYWLSVLIYTPGMSCQVITLDLIFFLFISHVVILHQTWIRTGVQGSVW